MKDKLPRYPFLFLAPLLVAGILLEQFFRLPFILLFSAAVLLLLGAVIFRRQKWSVYLLALLVLLFGSLNLKIWRLENIEHPILKYLPLKSVQVRGMVVEPPAVERRQFLLMAEDLSVGHQTVPLRRKFFIRTKTPLVGLLPGDRLILTNVTVRRLSHPRNPGQFDYRSFLQRRGVAGEIGLTAHSAIRKVKEEHGYFVHRVLYLLREKIDRRITASLPDTSARFLSAILLGKKDGLPADVKADFRNSGVAHVLAISGLHVGFVVIIIYLLLSFLPLGFRWHNNLTLLILGFYMLLTGAHPPVVRATLMVAIYLIGQNLERKPNVYNTVFAAAFLILFFQPQQLFRVGFQFSFAAVLSILYFYRELKPLENRIAALLPSGRAGDWTRKWVLIPFFVSLAAQLGTIPLMALYFNKIPLVSFLLNLAVIPLVAFIVPAGFLVIALSVFSASMAAMVGDLLAQAIKFLTSLVHLAANLPFAYLHIPALPFLAVLIYFLGIWLLLNAYKEDYRPVRLPAVVFLLILILWLAAPQSHSLRILMLDVGQGESTLVHTAGGRWLLFDAGPAYSRWDSGRDVIFPALRQQGTLHLDKVFISHPHADHIGGMFSLVRLAEIDSVYLPEVHITYRYQDSLLRVLARERIPYRLLKMGDVVRVDRSTRVYLLAPFPADLSPSRITGHSINNTSLVALLKSADGTVLFTGDAEKPVEKKLTGWGNLLQADVLKIGHHGSITSTGLPFLHQVSPPLALIPVGLRNKFGHPSPVVLQRLASADVEYYRTDEMGAIDLWGIRSRWRRVDWR